jgi:hypothetical protein
MAKALLFVAVSVVTSLALAGCAAPHAVDPSQGSVTAQSIQSGPLPSSPAAASGSPSVSSAPAEVTWHLAEGGVWVSTGTPPPCPEPVQLATPVDLALATSILYPGQVRGNAFKLHGGFRFDDNPDNNVTVRVPFDAVIVRGTHAMRNGTDIASTNHLEEQDGFEFIAPCGIMYTFGHLRRLAPEFQAVADSLPLVVGFNKTQYYDVDPPVKVHAGAVLATAVGFEQGRNVFLDWGVLDLRHTNGATLRPEWEQYRDEFDRYAVCWLDLLPPADAAKAHALRGGSQESGKESDYC